MRIRVKDILKRHIVPFETENDAIRELFSFFLHLAPTINSSTALKIKEAKTKEIWSEFIEEINISSSSFQIYKTSPLDEKNFEKYNLLCQSEIGRKYTRFVCCFKQKETEELECFLRHIRNSLAHSNVYMIDDRKKYILFEDYSSKNNITARILISQTNLKKLKRILLKYTN